jgi:hypothetical protein
MNGSDAGWDQLRRIVDANQYLVVATADANGVPRLTSSGCSDRAISGSRFSTSADLPADRACTVDLWQRQGRGLHLDGLPLSRVEGPPGLHRHHDP